MNNSLLLPILVVLVAGLLVALIKNSKGRGRTGTYRQRKLMTENEAEFFGRLVVALPDHYIFPQVAMSALLETTSTDKKTAHGDRLRIAQQRVDYVVCTKSCEVVAVVELDDKTHSRAKDQLRDARLEQAGIRTVRFQARQKPKVEAVRAMVLGSGLAEANKAPNETTPQATATTAA
jgi:very-short-patch-repair endonuclease